MVTVTVEEMQERLPDLLENVKLGEDVLITQGDQPFARLILATPKEPVKIQRLIGLQARKIDFVNGDETPQKQSWAPESRQNQILYIADDFNDPLELVETREFQRLQEIERRMILSDSH